MRRRREEEAWAGRGVRGASQGVRVGEVGVDRVGHRVERPHVRRELVDDVEVLAVHLGDDLAEQLLVLGADVLGVGVVRHALDPRLQLLLRSLVGHPLEAGAQLRRPLLAEQRHRLGVFEAEARAAVPQVLEGVLHAHRLELGLVLLVEAVEDGVERAVEHVERL